jgi:hypothetical protein
MASLLERSTNPGANPGGLTSGVDYFGNVGQQDNRAMNAGPATPASAEAEVPRGTGFSQKRVESIPSDTGGSGNDGMYAGDGGSGRMDPQTAFNAQMGAAGIGILGQLEKDPYLARFGGDASALIAANQGNYGPLAGRAAGMIWDNSLAGTVANLGTQYAQDKLQPSSIYNAGASMVPGGSLSNLGLTAATGFFGDMPTSLGEVIDYAPRGYQTFGNVGPVDAAQGQSVIERARDPLGAYLGTQGLDISGNKAAMQDAARALSYAQNISMDEAMASVGQQGAQAGSYGLPPPPAPEPAAPAPSPSGSAPSRSVADTFGTRPGSQQTAMLAEQEQYFGDTGGGWGYGYADGFGGQNGFSANTTEGSGYGTSMDGNAMAADGGLATSNGFMRPTPGITQRYNNGGMVNSTPSSGGGAALLTMGYADGGMVGMNGKPAPAMVQKRVDMILRDPEARQALLARPQQLMASGELTPEEVTTMARVAEAAMFNPELYPQLRAFVAEQGMTPLPPAYDPMVITRVLAISKALQEETPAGQVPNTDQAQVQSPTPGEGNGGYLQGPGTGRSDSIGTVNETTGQPVKVANGEYVVPAHVVRAKGREFFDNLLRRYSDVPKGE